MDQRLYIDGQLVDIDEDTNVDLDIKSNLFQDVSKIVSNSTLTVKLPKTVRNQRIFGHSNIVNAGSSFPYQLHTAQFFRNGVQLIRNGRAVCMSVTDTIEISIMWGLFPALSDINDNGTALNDLDSSARVKWNADEYSSYDDLLTVGYGYAEYDPFHPKDTGDAWQGVDITEGSMETTILSLDDGAVYTGTEIGATIAPVIDAEQTGYASVVAPFALGEKIQLTRVVGGADDYRLYAILDSANKVIALGDASNDGTAAGNYTINAPAASARIVINVIKARSQGYQVVISKGEGTAAAKVKSTRNSLSKYGDALYYVHPSVMANWILNLILEQTGVLFKWSGDAANLIDTLAIPLISNKSTGMTLDGSLDADFVPRDGNGTLKFILNSASSLFKEGAGEEIDTLTAVTDFSLNMDVQGSWNWNASGAQSQGSTTVNIDGVNVTVYRYTYEHSYIVMRVTPYNATEDEIQEYVIGENSTSPQTDTSDSLINGRFYHLLAGYGKIDITANSKITFELKNNRGTLAGTKFTGGTIKGSLEVGDSVPRGGYFPIAYNLPDIKIIDFVKFLAAITGTFPLQVTDGKTVEFVPFQTIWDNIPKAVDWTRRLVAQYSTNEPNEMDFSVSDYAQSNTYEWKDDDTVAGNYDGDLKINNKTLDDSRTVIEFPFAASDGNRVPIYTAVTLGSGTFGSTNTGTDPATVASTSNGGQYDACEDRILQVSKASDGHAVLDFHLGMNGILSEKYGLLKESLQQAKVIKERMALTDVEILNFDETAPVYLAQYGAYFAVTEIKQSDSNMADVTMFRIKEVFAKEDEPKSIKVTVTAKLEANGYNFTWQSDYPLGSMLYLTILDDTGDGDIEGLQLPKGASSGAVNAIMPLSKPFGVRVEKSDETDENTYTSELVFGSSISVEIGIGQENQLEYSCSEQLPYQITIFVVVVGANQHPTSVTLPAGQDHGSVGTNDNYPFTGLAYVSSECTKQTGDYNEYIITKR